MLETLRQPLEDSTVTICRAAGTVCFPAEFQLVAAANPCRRGCRTPDRCECTPGERARYLGRLSRPLLDRIDLHLEVPPIPYRELGAATAGEDSAAIRRRVLAARERQRVRFGRTRVRVNARMTARQLARCCPLSADGRTLVGRAVDRLGLSARAHDRLLKVARSVMNRGATRWSCRPQLCALAGRMVRAVCSKCRLEPRQGRQRWCRRCRPAHERERRRRLRQNRISEFFTDRGHRYIDVRVYKGRGRLLPTRTGLPIHVDKVADVIEGLREALRRDAEPGRVAHRGATWDSWPAVAEARVREVDGGAAEGTGSGPGIAGPWDVDDGWDAWRQRR